MACQSTIELASLNLAHTTTFPTTDGLTLAYTAPATGICSPSRKLSYVFVCNLAQEMLADVTVTANACTFTLTIQTKYACKNQAVFYLNGDLYDLRPLQL